MNRRRAIITFALLLACIAGIAVYPRHPDEPAYHGKSLSQWLDQLDDHAAIEGISWGYLPPKTQEQLDAANAIRAIGTNAIPRLMLDLSATNPPYYKYLQQGQTYLFQKILHRHDHPQPASPAVRIRWRAALALETLGPAVQPAIQQLAAIYTNQTSGSATACKDAAYILAGMGPPGIAVLTNSLTNSLSPNSWQYMSATWSIGQHPQSSTNLVPWLLDQLTIYMPGNTNGAGVQKGTRVLGGRSYPGEIFALGQIHADAEHVVPALIQFLTNANGSVQSFELSAAVEALGHYGKQASNAIPVLNTLTNNLQIQWQVNDVLKKISPDSK